MTLFEAMRPECVTTGLACADKQALLREIARIACKSPTLAGLTEETIFAALEEREKLGSTGFGDGIAIPHCRLDEVTDFVVGLVTVPDGVDFDALDNAPVRLIIFIVAPESGSNEHIRLLSAISQVLGQPQAVAGILSQQDSAAARESFLRHCRDEVDTTRHDSKNLFHVFVQDEDLFRDVLQVFAATDSSAVTVVDSHASSEYLAKMPLFAGFWSDSHIDYSKLIIAVVEKQMTNETIRQIERITGPLDECTNTLVTVQDIFFANGHLST